MSLTSNDNGLNYANFLGITYSGGTGISVCVKSGSGKLASIMVCSATTTPTLKLIDGITLGSGGSVIMPVFTPVSGTNYWFGAPILFQNGLYLESGGSVIGTVAYF